MYTWLNIWGDISEDIKFIRKRHQISTLRVWLSNRGFHGVFAYRISHFLYHHHLGLLSMVLTRLIQIIYCIDLDYRAKLEGGIVITHGECTAIGGDAEIGKGTEIYHGVTLGIRGGGGNDGVPKIGRYCMLGTGAKLLGPITVGDHCIIGANVVLTKSVPDNTIVKLPDPIIRPRGHVPSV